MPTITTVDPTWETGTTLDAAELRRADSAMFLGDGSPNGVRGGVVRHGDNSLAVTVNGSDQVTVQPGAAVIPAATGLGVYRVALSTATSPTGIASRNATNPRIDLVVFQIESGQAVVKTVDGTPSSSPSAPALPANAIEIVRLNIPAVGGGAVAVSYAFRSYATALGGTLYVENAARLPGSGNQKGQRAIAIDTGVEYQWGGSSWASGSPVPTGGSMEWWTNTPPTGFLLENGASVSRTTYAALFAVIGTTFGGGDGSTTFNLPNTMGRVVVARDAGQSEFDTLGETGGAKTHTLTAAEMPPHVHSQKVDASYNVGGGGPAGNYAQNNTGLNGVEGGLTTGSAGGGAAHNNLQPYIVANRIIKT